MRQMLKKKHLSRIYTKYCLINNDFKVFFLAIRCQSFIQYHSKSFQYHFFSLLHIIFFEFVMQYFRMNRFHANPGRMVSWNDCENFGGLLFSITFNLQLIKFRKEVELFQMWIQKYLDLIPTHRWSPYSRKIA